MTALPSVYPSTNLDRFIALKKLKQERKQNPHKSLYENLCDVFGKPPRDEGGVAFAYIDVGEIHEIVVQQPTYLSNKNIDQAVDEALELYLKYKIPPDLVKAAMIGWFGSNYSFDDINQPRFKQAVVEVIKILI